MFLRPELLIGAECSACTFPPASDHVIIKNRIELENVLPVNWENDIFYRTLHYVANSMHIILYNSINTMLTTQNIIRPLIYIMNTDNFTISSFNTTLADLASLDIFLFAAINNVTYADINLYAPFDVSLRKYAVIVFGNMYVPHTGHIVWNLGDYLIAIADNHEQMKYLCPLNNQVKGSIVGGYSGAVLNILRDNNINVPFRNRLLGPITLSNDLFSVVYGHIIIKRLARTLLRKYLFRENNEDLWIEVEHDLSTTLRIIQDAPCAPSLINVLVNDHNINHPNSTILNVEIQYARTGGTTQTIHVSIPLVTF